MQINDDSIVRGNCAGSHYGCCTVEAPYVWCTFWGTAWPANAQFMRHGNRGNIGFADGHAKEMSTDMACTCVWSPTYFNECHEVAYLARTQDVFTDYRYAANCIEDADGNKINP